MNAKQIENLFGHKLIGNKFMKRMVIKTLRLFPPDLIDKVAKTTWFVSSFEDGWAFTLRGDELGTGEHLVFLADELLEQSDSQIIRSIMHEIGHVVLGHRNSIGRVQSRNEVRKQEREADNFAKKYLD